MAGSSGGLVVDQNNRRYTGRMPKRDPRTQLRLNRVLGREVADDSQTTIQMPQMILPEINKVLAQNSELKQNLPGVLAKTEQLEKRFDGLENAVSKLIALLTPKEPAAPLAGEETKPTPPPPPAPPVQTAGAGKAGLGPTAPLGPTQPTGLKKPVGRRLAGGADMPPAEG